MRSVNKENNSKEPQYLGLAFILLLGIGAIFRFAFFADWSFSNDELSAIQRLKAENLSALIKNGIKIDGHPAFTQIFLYYWTKLVGLSTGLVRLPFVLFGVGSLYYFYQFSKNYFSTASAIAALAIVLSSGFFILYSQLARPYAPGLFFTMAFAHYWHLILYRDVPLNKIVICAFLGAFGIMSHYFSALGIVLLLLNGFFLIKMDTWKNYTILILGIGLICLPHLPTTIGHLKIGGLNWMPLPSDDFLWKYAMRIFNGFEFLIYYILGMAGTSILFCWKKIEKKHIVLLIVSILPYLIAKYYSLNYSPVLQFSSLLFSTPFALLLLTSLYGSFQKRYIPYIATLVFLIPMTYGLFANLNFYQNKPFANFKEVVQLTSEWSSGKKDVLIFANCNDPSYLRFFEKDGVDSIPYDLIGFNSESSIIAARELISNKNYNSILLSFANVPIPKEVIELARIHFPKVLEQKRFYNSEVLHLGKSMDERQYDRKYNPLNNTTNNWRLDMEQRDSSTFHTLPSSFKVEKENTYPLTFEGQIKDLFKKGEKDLVISTWLKFPENASGILSIDISREGESFFWRGYEIAPYRKNNEWFHLIKVLSLEKEIQAEDKIKIFVWNNNQSEFWVDDFELIRYSDSDYNYYE